MRLPGLLLALALSLTGAERLVFTKAFPGSTPAYIYICLDRDGSLAYKEAPQDDKPVQAKMPEADTAAVFALAEKLNYFKNPVESGLKVANTGKKTFRYEPATGSPNEAVFNYSIIPEAQQMLDRFEQIAASERAYLELDRTVHFDKLGVNDALAQLESLWLHKQLTAPQQFVPLLTRIASHETFMHLVRERAARLKEEFTGTVPPVNAADSKTASNQP